MGTQKNETAQHHSDGSSELDYGSVMAVGLSLGMIIGLLLDNIAMGIVGGMLLATISHAISQVRVGRKNAGAALFISLAAFVFLIVVWVFWG